jgi:hypothetical protein
MANQYPGEVVVLALAALTNVALALHLDSQLPEKLVGHVGLLLSSMLPVFLIASALQHRSPPAAQTAVKDFGALPPPHCEPALPCHCCPMQSRLVVLGGAFNCNGNVNPAAEANIYGDPDAANVVFSRWGQAG